MKKTETQNSMYSFFLMILVALLVFSMMFGVAYAHYQKTKNDLLIFKGAHSPLVNISDSTGGVLSSNWGAVEGVENGYALDFCLKNTTTGSEASNRMQEVSISVFATIGDTKLSEGENTEVLLKVHETIYRATAEKVEKNSIIWTKYGEGTLYRFYNETGEEICWTFPEGQGVTIPMQLTVNGSEKNTAFVLIPIYTYKD